MCRELLQKYKEDKAAGRYDHAKPAAPGSAPPEIQAFMKEVRDFMQEQKGLRRSPTALPDAVLTYEEQLAEHERMREHIQRVAELDADWGPDVGGAHFAAIGMLLHCRSHAQCMGTAMSAHLSVRLVVSLALLLLYRNANC